MAKREGKGVHRLPLSSERAPRRLKHPFAPVMVGKPACGAPSAAPSEEIDIGPDSAEDVGPEASRQVVTPPRMGEPA